MNSKHGSGPENGFPHTPTRRGPALTDFQPTNSLTSRIGKICSGYNELPPGAPLLVIRYAQPSHAENGARRESHRPSVSAPIAIVLAVKPVGSGPGRMAKDGVVLPVSSFAEHASGRNAIVEQTIAIGNADIQNQSSEVFCGEAAIFGWMFSQSEQKPIVSWLTSEQVLTWTLCRLAKKIGYVFSSLEAENTHVAAAIGERLKSLAAFALLKPRTGKAIDSAKAIVSELMLVGLEEMAISEGLFAILRQEIIAFMAAVLDKKR